MTVGHVQGARIGEPSLGIAEDMLDLIVNLLVLGARRARPKLLGLAAFNENGASVEVFKGIVAAQRRFRIRSVEFHPEGILLGDGRTAPTRYRGRIDFLVKTKEQFAEYDKYFGIECKLLRAGQPSKTRYYARAGVGKYVDGTYSPGHPRAMLVGFVLDRGGRETVSGDALIDAMADVERSVAKNHVGASTFTAWRRSFRDALVKECLVPRTSSEPISLLHALLRMFP